MCSTDVYCSKQTGSSSTRNHHPIISSFLELGRRKLSMQPKFVAARNVVKTETQQTFVNGLLGFITLGIYTPLERVCIAHNNYELPIDMGNSICCSLIYFWVPSSCFCIVISLSLRWNNPVQRCLPVGGRLHYPRRRRWWLHALTTELLW